MLFLTYGTEPSQQQCKPLQSQSYVESVVSVALPYRCLNHEVKGTPSYHVACSQNSLPATGSRFSRWLCKVCTSTTSQSEHSACSIGASHCMDWCRNSDWPATQQPSTQGKYKKWLRIPNLNPSR